VSIFYVILAHISLLLNLSCISSLDFPNKSYNNKIFLDLVYLHYVVHEGQDLWEVVNGS